MAKITWEYRTMHRGDHYEIQQGYDGDWEVVGKANSINEAKALLALLREEKEDK